MLVVYLVSDFNLLGISLTLAMSSTSLNQSLLARDTLQRTIEEREEEERTLSLQGTVTRLFVFHSTSLPIPTTEKAIALTTLGDKYFFGYGFPQSYENAFQKYMVPYSYSFILILYTY